MKHGERLCLRLCLSGLTVMPMVMLSEGGSYMITMQCLTHLPVETDIKCIVSVSECMRNEY